jgi:hypothetical protein
MASEKQITGTIALLGAAAVAVVTVLLGVLYWEKIGVPFFDNSPQASVQPLQGAGTQACRRCSGHTVLRRGADRA